MSISIGAEYTLPDEDDDRQGSGSHTSERMAVVDDLNVKLQVIFFRTRRKCTFRISCSYCPLICVYSTRVQSSNSPSSSPRHIAIM